MDNIPPQTIECINNFENILFTSMSDDLHTPVVLAALSDPLKTANDLLHTRKVCWVADNFFQVDWIYKSDIMHHYINEFSNGEILKTSALLS